MISLKFRRFIIGVTAIILFSVLMPAANITSYAMLESITAAEDSNPQFTTRAEIIDWRYKVEDGKVYRRLYNYSRQQWVGEWEWCP